MSCSGFEKRLERVETMWTMWVGNERVSVMDEYWRKHKPKEKVWCEECEHRLPVGADKNLDISDHLCIVSSFRNRGRVASSLSMLFGIFERCTVINRNNDCPKFERRDC